MDDKKRLKILLGLLGIGAICYFIFSPPKVDMTAARKAAETDLKKMQDQQVAQLNALPAPPGSPKKSQSRESNPNAAASTLPEVRVPTSIAPPAPSAEPPRIIEPIAPPVDPQPPAPLAAAPPPAPVMSSIAMPAPQDLVEESGGESTRFVYLQFPEFSIRFKVASYMTPEALKKIAKVLKGTCVVEQIDSSNCKSNLEIDGTEFQALVSATREVDAESFVDSNSQKVLKLSCHSSQPDCLDNGFNEHRFSVSSHGTQGKVLAYDGEVIPFKTIKKHSQRDPASVASVPPKTRIRNCFTTEIDQQSRPSQTP